jgi:hypothetical protein
VRIHLDLLQEHRLQRRGDDWFVQYANHAHGVAHTVGDEPHIRLVHPPELTGLHESGRDRCPRGHVAQTTAARGVRGHLIENQVPRVEGLGELSRCLGQSRLPFEGVGAGERHQSSTSSPPWMSSTWLAWLATSRQSGSAGTAA